MQYRYSTREIRVENGNRTLYGVAYVPEGAGEKRPLVLFSHELGRNHCSGLPYGEKLAEAGFAFYAFDFYGGTVGRENRSGGKNTEMSLMTEFSDLEAVLRAAKTWSFADPERIILMGGSQGGAVSALAGCRHPEEIAAMALLYPALNIPALVHHNFRSLEDLPDEYDLLDGRIRVSRIYGADVWDLDYAKELPHFQKPVLIVHGDRDPLVPLSVSQDAAERLPNCELKLIPGAGHGFSDAAFTQASGSVLSFLQRVF